MTIDIHTHVAPGEYPVGGGTHRFRMEPGCDCRHRRMIVDGKAFRTTGDEHWDLERRLEMMAEVGVTRQVLSPLPELLSYWWPVEEGEAVCNHVNGLIGSMVERAPDHFSGLGGVPLQDPALAARTLEKLMASGLFRGVEVGAHVNGAPIGDPRFAEFFAAAEELNASVFVHPERSFNDRLIGPGVLSNLVAHPCETAFAITSLMTGGIIERHPKLRLAFAHGGGAFALLLPRLQLGWGSGGAVTELMTRAPNELARTLYYDAVIYDRAVLPFLAQSFGVSQLCTGSDFPARPPAGFPTEMLADFSEAEQRLMQVENPRRWLGEL